MGGTKAHPHNPILAAVIGLEEGSPKLSGLLVDRERVNLALRLHLGL
jgi:hypothetical protein